ncbi:NAD(P)-dependent oxidoreductase [Furfurilactobacillus sp. WILCCON 0119]|uniref:NAD(P)-dependent oxidoreductase n=1 Tax=Furfurilactobacillus entadae TaxID=2922307 RepID=UPI0038B3B6CE
MKIGIIGATGKTGQALLKVAHDRQLAVTAIIRDPTKLADKTVPVIVRDVFALTSSDVSDFDVLICAFASGKKSLYARVNQHLATLLENRSTRLIVVGSGATLFTDNLRTKTVADQLPLLMKPASAAHFKALTVLKTAPGLNWTYVAPPMNYLPAGPATGQYQVGTDVLLYDHQHKSQISYADMAVALLDEAVTNAHPNSVMTVAWR